MQNVNTFWLQSCDSRCLAALSVGSFSKLTLIQRKNKQTTNKEKFIAHQMIVNNKIKTDENDFVAIYHRIIS